jgi:signal transduction histidine kinase
LLLNGGEAQSKNKLMLDLTNKLSLKDEIKDNYISFQIKIIDTGVGISKENLPKLFMNFGKLEEHAAGNKTGTGLGLSICKSLLELMGGSVTVESEVGVGTTFIM